MNIGEVRLPIPFSDLIYDRIGTKETYCIEAIFQEKEVMNNNNKFLCKVWYPYLFLRTRTKRKLWIKQSIFFFVKKDYCSPLVHFSRCTLSCFLLHSWTNLVCNPFKESKSKHYSCFMILRQLLSKNKYIIKRDEIHEFHSYGKFLLFASPNRVLCFLCMTNT